MKTVLTIAATLMLSGCFGAVRPCGTFDVREGGGWSTADQIGESVTFAGVAGARFEIELVWRKDSKPYTGQNLYGPTNPSSVICRPSSLRRYKFGEVDAGLLIELTQSEVLDRPLEARDTSIRAYFEAPSGRTLHSFSPELWELERHEPEDLVYPSVTQRVLRNASFGGVQYDVAVEEIHTDTTHIESITPGGVEPVSGLTFAHDQIRGGLVRIYFANGEVFTRVD